MKINKENLDLMHEVLDECESLLKIEYKNSDYEQGIAYVKAIIGLVRQGKMIPLERLKSIAWQGTNKKLIDGYWYVKLADLKLA